MIDYKLIADEDPGGDLQTAFDTMAAVTIEVRKSRAIYNSLGLAAAIGFTNANEFLNDVEASTLIPERVVMWINTTGVDIVNADTALILKVIAPQHLDLVLALANETISKYGARFRMGHLQNAREYRARGKV